MAIAGATGPLATGDLPTAGKLIGETSGSSAIGTDGGASEALNVTRMVSFFNVTFEVGLTCDETDL